MKFRKKPIVIEAERFFPNKAFPRIATGRDKTGQP